MYTPFALSRINPAPSSEKMNSHAHKYFHHECKSFLIPIPRCRPRPSNTCREQGFGETHPHNPKVVSDMTALHHIHEASILYNLGERAKLENQRPYTFMVRPEAEGRKKGGEGGEGRGL